MKMIRGKILETEALKAVEQCFLEVPDCVVDFLPAAENANTSVDFIATLKVRKKAFTLLIEVRPSGQPRFVREAVNELERYKPRFSNSYGILVAPFISAQAGEILLAEDLGYIDLAGNCRIAIDGIYIHKEGRKSPFTQKRDLRSLYSPKGERVIRTLLLAPKKLWKVEELARAACVSLGQVSNIKKLLQSREWLLRDASGLKLVQPEKLLDEWVSVYPFRRHRMLECYSLDTLSEIEAQLAGKSVENSFGVLGAFSAAARFSPAVRYQRATAFVRSSCEAVVQELGWKSVASGGNVVLIEPYDEGVFFGSQEIEGVEVVSPVQTYLDLRNHSGRGEEAAEALLRDVLRSSW